MASSKQGVALSIPWWHFLRWQYLPGLSSGLLGFKAGIWFYSLIALQAVSIIIFFVLNDKEEAPSVEVKKKTEHRKNTSMTSVLRQKPSGLSLFNVFFHMRFMWPDILHSFLKNIYLLPVALVGAYGIINQYCLKMIGGPIGGMISDKILKSPSKYLCYTFIIWVPLRSHC